jgi:hypothetical protein
VRDFKFWEGIFLIGVAFIQGFFVGAAYVMRKLEEHIKNCDSLPHGDRKNKNRI